MYELGQKSIMHKSYSSQRERESIHTICLIAISSDFLEIVLPNPVLSDAIEEVFTDLRVAKSDTCEALRDSDPSATRPLVFKRPFPTGSVSLPLATMGDECLLGTFEGPVVSAFPLVWIAAPGRDLPAETGLSGKVVLRFDGVSRGKSGGTIGCCGGRTRGLGELGRDPGERPFDKKRADEAVELGVTDGDGAGLLRVGVEGREFGRAADGLKFAGICDLEVGVDGLEFWDGRLLSTELIAETGRALEGVEGRDNVGRDDGVEGLAVDVERILGEEGLM